MLRRLQRTILPRLGPEITGPIKKLLPSAFEIWYRRASRDGYLLSFPCSGRTWVRLLVGRALQQAYDRPDITPYEPHEFALVGCDVSRLTVSHDGHPHLRTAEEIERDKSAYKGTRVVLLARDPRDVMVSWFFEQTKRRYLPGSESIVIDGDIDAFVLQARGGLPALISYYNSWAAARSVPDDFLLIRYEDFQTDTVAALRQVLTFIGANDVPEEILSGAVEYASFDNMRRMEKEDSLGTIAFKPADAGDEESYKTRAGKVGGYQSYLRADTIERMNAMIEAGLDPSFGYRK